jgi:hypothetical protein
MRQRPGFKRSGLSFAEQIGAPDEFQAAMGRIALGFSFLEDSVRNLILLLSRTERRVGHTLTAQLSFKQKMEVLEALIADESSRITDAEAKEELADTLHLCRISEELRNTYLHSSYSGTLRVKVAARGKRGLTVAKDQVDSGLLLDVADFITDAGVRIEQAAILLEYADLIEGGPDYVTFRKHDKVVATFRFGEVE